MRRIKPLATVEHAEFWELLSHFQPCYKLPTRPYFKKMIEPQVVEMMAKLKDYMKDSWMVAFTTDIWTDATTRESFISVTCHWINKFWQRRDFVLNCSHFPAKHTACNIAEKLQESFQQWDIATNEIGLDKKSIVVRDGASNMRAGCDEVPVDSVHCLIHLLQLVV